MLKRNFEESHLTESSEYFPIIFSFSIIAMGPSTSDLFLKLTSPFPPEHDGGRISHKTPFFAFQTVFEFPTSLCHQHVYETKSCSERDYHKKTPPFWRKN